MCDFYPGQEVICIDDFPQGESMTALKAGEIFTIRECVIHPLHGRMGLRLAEVVNPPEDTIFGHLERAYAAYGFRPLIRKSLPECLTRLLDTPVEREVERA